MFFIFNFLRDANFHDAPLELVGVLLVKNVRKLFSDFKVSFPYIPVGGFLIPARSRATLRSSVKIHLTKLNLFIVALALFGLLGARVFADSKVIRADPSNLPPIDYSKKFEAGESNLVQRQLELNSLGWENVELPTYSGNLTPVRLNEWQSSKSDFYSRSIDFREAEMKHVLEKWHAQSFMKSNVSLRDEAIIREDAVDVPTVPIESKETEVKTHEGDDLRQVINKGREAPSVKVGRGYDAKEIKGLNSPESQSPPKSESSQ
jgi:hypothetical protein